MSAPAPSKLHPPPHASQAPHDGAAAAASVSSGLELGFQTIELGSTVPGLPLYEARGYVAFHTVHQIGANGEKSTIIHMRKPL